MMYGGLFDIDKKIERRDILNSEINDVNFWNREDRDKVISEFNSLNDLVDKIRGVCNKIDTNILILSDEIDNDMYEVIRDEYYEVFEIVNGIRLETYLSMPYDKNDCILEIHSGAGGTEACDWAMMLLRMYTRYLTKNGYSYKEIDRQPGEEVGIKSVMLRISFLNAYGYLKGERGVHRLVRISPFDANKRRHTSFASVEVTPVFDNDIDIKINDSDLRIDIYRSSGPGGQGVNTTDSAVRITHIPTGIVVTCQNERSQIRNKEIAMEILKNKLYSLELEERNKKLDDIKGGHQSIGFGSGKRSYVMCPYTLVKDNLSKYESSDVEGILDGDIGEMLEKNLRRN